MFWLVLVVGFLFGLLVLLWVSPTLQDSMSCTQVAPLLEYLGVF